MRIGLPAREWEALVRQALAALLFVVLAACGTTDDVTEGGGASPPAGATDTPASPECADLTGEEAGAPVRLEDFEFSPSCFTMKSSQGLSLHNAGSVVHNFTIADTQVDLDTQPDADTNTESIGGVVTAGTHRFFCKYHEDRGMVGEVRVVS